MHYVNEFVLILDRQLAHYPAEQRHHLRDRILDDLTSTTDILKPIDWGYEDSSENDELDQPIVNIKDRILKKQEELQIEPEPEIPIVKINRWGRSDLHEAIAISDLEAIKSSLAQKKDIHSKDNNGNTPLDFAMLEANDEVIALFREAGLLS